MNNSDSEILITVLNSTSSLLEHYRYDGDYPTLNELQHLIGRAIANLEDREMAARPPGVKSSGEHLESQYQ